MQGSGDILAEKRRRQNHLQQEQLSDASTTTRPGAVHIQGWDHFDDSDSSESSESTVHDVFNAQVVDEDEMQGHAELLFQQMLSQATVAEHVNEEEMRHQAHEQATREFQEQQQRLKDQGTVATQDGVTINNNKKRQQQRVRIIAGGFFFMAAIIIAIVVVVTAVFLQQRGGGDDAAADLLSLSLLRNITPSVIPSFSPSITPSVSFSPIMAPSSMPSSTSSWQQIGNSINGIQEYEEFGSDLGFSAEGNTVVATASSWNETHAISQVRAYSYRNETDKWKQLGQYIMLEASDYKLCLSPNGKYMGVHVSSYGLTSENSMFHIFALRDNKMNVTAEDDIAAAMFWEQIGPDIVLSPDLIFMSSSLTDNLVLALAFDNLVYTYQFDMNQSDWVRMGQEIQMESVFSMQLVLNKSTGTLLLAMGGRRSVRTFRYEPDTDSWIQFGSELAADDDEDSFGVLISLSMDGETLVVGVKEYFFGTGIRLLQTFSYDTATDDWIQLGKDLQDASFSFGLSFSLSANGKVLVATTQKIEIRLQDLSGLVTGQVRTWDFVADAGGGGEWIQRGAALEVGTPDSKFGYKIALSSDGNRLATSSISALNERGVESGKLRVFEHQAPPP